MEKNSLGSVVAWYAGGIHNGLFLIAVQWLLCSESSQLRAQWMPAAMKAPGSTTGGLSDILAGIQELSSYLVAVALKSQVLPLASKGVLSKIRTETVIKKFQREMKLLKSILYFNIPV